MTPDDFGLTARQLRILQGLADGESLDDIGRDLGVAWSTTRNDLHRATRALGVTNKIHAVAAAMRKDLID